MSKAVSRGQALEVSARVATQVNWDELDGEKLQVEIINLSPAEFGSCFTAFLKNGSMVQVSGSLRYDKRKDGWKLIENTPRRLNSVADIQGVSFLKGNETHINGDEMVCRAVELDANLGQEDAEFLLEHQVGIPKKLRGRYLVFPGTKWQVSGESRSVPYLVWNGDRWILSFGWLDGDWGSYARLGRPRK